MKTELLKRYVQVGRDKKHVLEDIRLLLLSKSSLLYKVFGEYHRSAGKSGNLSAETGEIEVYSGEERTGFLQLYWVTDDSANDYALHISLICCGEAFSCVKGLEDLLKRHEFVSSHASFKERPCGFKNYDAYLDEPYVVMRSQPFSAIAEARASRA